MRRRQNVLLIFAALSVISCRTTEFGFKVFDINGMVYDFSNRPVVYCDISLGRRGLKSSSDINGRFSVSRIPLGKYTLTVYKDGFEKYSEDVFIRGTGQIIYVRIPSQNQLLNLADEALTANNFNLAEEMVERAYQIDPNNIEMLFYFATIKFRQQDYKAALGFLETAKNLGSKDLYIDKFITQLRRRKDANNTYF